MLQDMKKSCSVVWSVNHMPVTVHLHMYVLEKVGNTIVYVQ